MSSPSVESRPSFREQLQRGWDQGKFVCLGFDPDDGKLPPHLRNKYEGDGSQIVEDFVESIVATTSDLVLAYKPNIAFYEHDSEITEALEWIVSDIAKTDPRVPVIGDVKRADIGNTNKGYARMAFERFGFDAITTNPYFGHDTYKPFLDYPGKGLIVLCKTTNPGAALYQDTPVVLEHYQRQQELDKKNGEPLSDEEFECLKRSAIEFRTKDEKDTFGVSTVPLYWIIAARTGTLAKENPNIGLVVGATFPESFQPIRFLAEDAFFLMPGIGTQGGNLEKVLQYALNSKRQGVIVSASSSLTYASNGEDFAEAARAATLELDQQIRKELGII